MFKTIYTAASKSVFPRVAQNAACLRFHSVLSNNRSRTWMAPILGRLAEQKKRTFCQKAPVVEMRGLDPEATEQDVRDFFRSLNITPTSVQLRCDNSGRVSGACDIHFKTHAEAVIAMRKKHSFIGHRFIRLKLKSSTSEENYNKRSKDGLQEGAWTFDRTSNSGGHFVRMKGLPSRTTEQSIFNFFWPLNIRPVSIRPVYSENSQTPSEFDVAFLSHEEAVKAMSKNNAYLGNRFIELTLNSRSDSANAEETETINRSVVNDNYKTSFSSN